MKEAETTSAHNRTMYSIVEAAALTECSVENLLQHGELRRLPILARVPDGVLVYCTNLDLLDLANPALDELTRRMRSSYFDGIYPLARRDIQLLVLTPADCRLVNSHGESYQSVFLTGVAFGGVSDLVFVEPTALDVRDGHYDLRPSRRFACYPVEYDPRASGAPMRTAPMKIKLTMDMLRVRRDDLEALELLRAVDDQSVKFDNGFRVEPHISRGLICLNEGARRFWDRSRLGWLPPRPKVVQDWFRLNCKFSVKVAEGAAQILLTSYKDWDQGEYETKKARNEINMFDAVVEVAAGWKNADLGRGDRADQIDTYPDKQESLDLLKSRFGFADHTALAAWLIAKPDDAKVIGRPREHDDGM